MDFKVIAEVFMRIHINIVSLEVRMETHGKS